MQDAGLFWVHKLAFALTPEVNHEEPQIEHLGSKLSFHPLHSLYEVNVLPFARDVWLEFLQQQQQ
jgi:hypothetical protein